MNGVVYDMSNFEHPGGDDVLKEFAGCVKDGQDAFDGQEHPKAAKN